MNDQILKIASLVLDFGKVNRLTFHQDGIHPESDTDHTVMLGVLGTALASNLYKDLDLGLIAQFALIHDLVEVYAGDTPTLMGISPELFKQKEIREQEALDQIKKEFGDDFSWIHEMIEKYEKLDTKEARFIKVLDKVLPKLTVVLNNAKAIHDKKLATKEGATKTFEIQRELIQRLAYDMPELVQIWEFFVTEELNLYKQ
ncbi:MAG: HD domain-containing protein [Minisyncoccota bacterium]